MSQDRYDEIVLDGVPFKLDQPMSLVDLTRFQGKSVYGDYKKEDNLLLSTWVISDLTGGHEVGKLRIGTDQNRYRFSTLYARIPGMIALPRYQTSYAGPNSTRAAYLGDLYESGTYKAYADFGGKLCRWDETTKAWSASLGNLAGASAGKGCEFKGSGTRMLFIPCGTSGYSTWDGSTLTNDASKLALSFVVWADRLVMLDTDGQLWHSEDGTTWTSYGTTGKVDASFIPRELVVYFNRADNPTVFAVTNRGLFAFDPDGPQLYLTEVQYPPHPYQALGSDVWRGSLFISNGMGITMYVPGVDNPGVGLDRDDGLPDDYRGYITDLQAEYNGLYALVVGSASGSNNYTSVHVWTGFGWHCEYASTSRTALSKITWLGVSQAQGVSRLWWGENGSLRTIKLPTDFANPRALTSAGTGSFADDDAAYYTFESGRFDADMENYQKVANTVELRVAGADPGGLLVDYRRNGDAAYTNLTYAPSPVIGISAVGTYALQFGTALSGGSGYGGVTFNDIELRLRMVGGGGTEATTTPYVEYLALTFRKIVPGSKSWTARIDLRGPHKGKSPEQLRTKLAALLNLAGFFEMQHRGTYYRVCFAQLTGQDETGDDTRGVRTVNIIELPGTGIVAGPTIAG